MPQLTGDTVETGGPWSRRGATPPLLRDYLLPALATAAAAGTALALARVSGSLAEGRTLLLGLGLGIGAAFFVLAMARADIAAVVTFALLAFVRHDPAPVDGAFAILGLALACGWRLRWRLPSGIALSLPLFAAVTVVSAANAHDTGRAFRFAGITLFLLLVAVGVRALSGVPRAIACAFEAYIAVAAATAALATLELALHFPGGGILLYDPHRVQALFKDPNVFAPFLVPAIVTTLDRLTTRSLSHRRMVVMLVELTALVAGVLFAFSRAAWLNLAVATAFLMLVRIRHDGANAASRVLVMGMAAAGLVYVLLAETGSTSFLQQRSGLQTYDQSRFANQIAALHAAGHHAFGYGPGQAEVNLPLSTHSTYARSAYEQGLLGLALLLLLLLFTLHAAFGLAMRGAPAFGIGGAPLLGAWAGLVVNSAFIDTLHWRHLWVLAGIIWAAAIDQPAAAPATTRASAP